MKMFIEFMRLTWLFIKNEPLSAIFIIFAFIMITGMLGGFDFLGRI